MARRIDTKGCGANDRRRWAGIALGITVVLGVSCRSMPPLPAVDLSTPGWRVRQGQAVWRPAKDKPELAGELLVATRAGGDFFVQFAKDPFPLATAQVVENRWQIEFGAGQYRRGGRGRPPLRFGWFELADALAGVAPVGDWSFERLPAHFWRLKNRRTGEKLEGYLCP